jgi:DNA-binding NtrC family response regulator
VLITEASTLFPEHLPEGMKTPNTFVSQAFENALSIEEYTKQFILKYQARNTEQKLAEMLGITRKALWEKRKRWSLKKK